MLTNTNENPMVVAVARVRQSVLQRATSLISGASPLPLTEQYDALPNVSALLMTSLEELKVAEEELRQQNSLLVEQRAGIDRRVHRYQQLFLEAPVASLVTDRLGTIQEANTAAGRLLRRDRVRLEQKPLTALIPTNARDTFRRELARLTDDGVTDWHLTLSRVGDVPIEVSAAVQKIDGVGRTGSSGLYWVLRPIALNG